MTSTADRKAALLARRDDLRGRLASIGQELDSHQSKDWEDLATEREGDEVLETMGLTGQQELRAIDAALKRIEAGEYGDCVRCGGRIESERLDLMPWTPFCRACASQGGRP